MPREILVQTPENIEIEYELGGLGSRVVALAVDALFQLVIFIGIALVAGLLGGLLSLSDKAWARETEAFLGNIVQALATIIFFAVQWGYFIWFEARWNGQTPGKRQQGLRVVRDGGYPIGIYGAITRNLMRVVDGIPLLTGILIIIAFGDKAFNGHTLPSGVAAIGGLQVLISLCFILFSARNQRVGDIIAGTMVVKQRAPRVPTLEALAPPPRVLPEHLASFALADISRHVDNMTVPEYRAVRHAIDRRWQLPPPVQQASAMRLAVPLMERLGIRPPEGVVSINYADLLEYLSVAFEQRRGVK